MIPICYLFGKYYVKHFLYFSEKSEIIFMIKTKIFPILLIINIIIYSFFSYPFEAKAADTPNISSDTVVIFDLSGSMKRIDTNNSIFDSLLLIFDINYNKNNRIGFIAYNEDIELEIPLSFITDKNYQQINLDITNLSYRYNTDLGYALKNALSMLSDSTSANKSIIVISDGETTLASSRLRRTNNDNLNDQALAIKDAKNDKIKIHTITLDGMYNANINQTKKLSSETGGSHFLINKSPRYVDNILEAYAKIKNLSLTKISAFESANKKLNIPVELPYIDYVSDLAYVVTSDLKLAGCSYSDSTNSDLFLHSYHSTVVNASTTLSKQNLSINIDSPTDINVYALKNIDINPVITYEQEENKPSKFIAKLYDSNDNLISSDYELPINVSVSQKDTNISDTLSLKKDTSFYYRDYVFPDAGEFVCQATVIIDNLKYKSKPLSVLSNLQGPIALDMPEIRVPRGSNYQMAMGDYFQYRDKSNLNYELIKSNVLSDEMVQDGTYLTINNLGTKANGNIVLRAIDPDKNIADATVSISVFTPIYVYIAAILALLLLLIAIIMFIWFQKKRINSKFTGIILGYFIHTSHGRDLPELYWLEDVISKYSKLTLQDLFDILNVKENIPEAKNIFFVAKPNNQILFYHKTNCNILLASSTVHKKQKFLLNYGDKLFITFEDATTEIEIIYRRPGIPKATKRFAIPLN